ncbi:MAG: hypothetical protein MJ162_00435 [Treponema sp.]|nr:hypothetical protein [Treponema sp.]
MKHYRIFCFFICLFLFSGCENFLEGSDLKDKISEEIEYNSSENVNIRVFTDINSGVTYPNGDVSRKVGYEFDISYIPNNLYFFKKWKAVFKSTGADASDFVSFKKETDIETKATVLVNNPDILITPVYVEKPYVNFSIPSNQKEGLVRNMTTKISFSKEMDPSTFTAENISVYEGVQNIVNGDIEFISTNAVPKLKEFSLSQSGKVLSIELKDNIFYKDTSTIVITISKNIKAIDGAPLAEDYSLRFSVSSYIDGLAPRIKNVSAGIGEDDFTSIPVYFPEDVPELESIENLRNLAKKLFTFISTNSFNLHVKAADISGFGKGQSINSENEMDVEKIGIKLTCLYKFSNGNLVKTNPTDSDYYSETTYRNYISGQDGTDFSVNYSDYLVNNEVLPAPDGLYRIDVFADDKYGNSGLTEKNFSEYKNGCVTFYLLRDVTPVKLGNFSLYSPLTGNKTNGSLKDNGWISFKVDEDGSGVKDLDITVLDSEDNIIKNYSYTDSDENIQVKFCQEDFFLAAKIISDNSDEDDSTTKLNSGYYFISGLTNDLTENQTYKVQVSAKDVCNETKVEEFTLKKDDTSPWFRGGENNNHDTTGPVVASYSYTTGNNTENVYPRVNNPGVPGTEFWDSPDIVNNDNVPVRWFYTNADRNGSYGVNLKIELFDNSAAKGLYYLQHSTSVLSDAELAKITAKDIISNSSKSQIDNIQLNYSIFFKTGTFSIVAYDEAGNISPAYTFCVVKDDQQPAKAAMDGTDLNNLMYIDPAGATATFKFGDANFDKNRYTNVNNKNFFDWWEDTGHKMTYMRVRNYTIRGTYNQIKNAKVVFVMDGNADTSKNSFLGAPVTSGNDGKEDYYLHASRYEDAKPGRNCSGIAQYIVSRTYTDWRTDNGENFICTFPPETNLNTRFTGGQKLFSSPSKTNEDLKNDRSYRSEVSNYFDEWQNYTAGTNINMYIFKNFNNTNIKYEYMPPITLCLKDNCGNINYEIVNRADWPDYAGFVYQLQYTD